MKIVSKYAPRPHFLPFHLRGTRWSVLVAHRRAGKTVAAVNDLIERATRNPRPSPRYAYVAPLRNQAKDIAWTYLKDFASPYKPKISESELYVELTALPNSPRITLYGADNPDSFRGMYFDGVVLDEFGDMLGSVFKEILLPALVDRRGWAVFMGTPKGPNHFRDMFYKRKKDPNWAVFFMPVTDTKLIPEEDLAEMKTLMDEEQYAQEMLCSFEASVRGAIYARQIETAIHELRVGKFPLQRHLPTDVIMDLGFRDLSTIGFAQSRPDGIVMGHVHGDNMKPISHYINYIKSYIKENGLKLGQIWLPHDARAKSLQTGKSIIENFRDVNLRPKIVPKLDLLDGIAAVRKMFPHWYFNEDECEEFLLAAKTYHREYDEENKIYKDTPVHDWSSHYMDMFRYACLSQNPTKMAKLDKDAIVKPAVGGVHYAFRLNDIWDLVPQRSGRL